MTIARPIARPSPSRPLRALGGLLLGYVALRATVVGLSDASITVTAPAAPSAEVRVVRRALALPLPVPTETNTLSARGARTLPIAELASAINSLRAPERIPPRQGPLTRSDRGNTGHVERPDADAPAADPTWVMAAVVPAAGPLPRGEGRAPGSRWHGSLWTIVRGAAGPAVADGGQLGGSQAGLRLYWRATPLVSLTARVSVPLGTAGRDVAAGVALRRGNFGLLAERRFALDRGSRDRIVVTAFGGFDRVALPLSFTLDGYAQGGIAGRAAFADGALRAERLLARLPGTTVAVGLGAWAAAQSGAARIDVGPQVVAHIVAADRPIRLSAEWRQRIGGAARPGSGPVITLGTDF